VKKLTQDELDKMVLEEMEGSAPREKGGALQRLIAAAKGARAGTQPGPGQTPGPVEMPGPVEEMEIPA